MERQDHTGSESDTLDPDPGIRLKGFEMALYMSPLLLFPLLIALAAASRIFLFIQMAEAALLGMPLGGALAIATGIGQLCATRPAPQSRRPFLFLLMGACELTVFIAIALFFFERMYIQR
ncbi:MAG: hypothetical protein LC772_06280 [Chloroflexi bacterium]|nr:hypothetical protein [Chloroflexota bacterium]